MNCVPPADADLTLDRSELKYCVSLSNARELARGVNEHMQPFRFTGPGANRLPGARHFVTTVYFDTASFELHARAKANPNSLKVRAKEYYDQHVTLTELAKDRTDLFRSSPILWVELKKTAGSRSGKRRVGIPKPEVPAFFATGAISEKMLEIQRQVHGGAAQAVLDVLLEVCREFSTPLRPSVLVNYRRSAWQDVHDSVRVTIDRDLAFFAPRDDMWIESLGLERENLGASIGEQPGCIVEVKHTGTVPTWLQHLLPPQPPVRFSKFVAASDAMVAAGLSR